MLIRQRKTEMLIRIYPGYNISHGELRAAEKLVVNSEYEDFSDFVKKFGDVLSDNPVPVAYDKVGNYYEGIGVLLRQKLVDADLVYPLIGPKIICYWEKMLPYTKGLRGSCGDDSTWEYYEFLYDEMRRAANPRSGSS
ncbi:MAG: hypothetical protein LUQ39_01430 [Methanomassiliicoccales archaeon]|nr:hypothetical protein [Methanomassiliicoccales archaeon]